MKQFDSEKTTQHRITCLLKLYAKTKKEDYMIRAQDELSKVSSKQGDSNNG